MANSSATRPEYPDTGIPLPEQTQQNDSFFHHTETVTQWLKSLPLASPLECAKLLYKTIYEMNRIELDANQRITVLEAIGKSVITITDNLKSRYAATPFPLSEKNHKIALLSRELAREIVLGYKSAIADHIRANKVSEHKNPHAIAINRAMFYLSKVLLHSYLIYETQPPATWHEAHLLFTYSSVNKFDRIAVENLEGSEFPAQNARQIYTRMLLLSAASPYQLRQREMDALCKELDQLLDKVKLKVNAIAEHQTDGFIINLHADKPPMHINSSSKPTSRQFFLMDTSSLVQALEHSLSSNASEDQKISALSPHLKTVLIKNWGPTPHRQYVRTQLNFELKISVGINEIHEQLASDEPDITAPHQPQNGGLFLSDSQAKRRPRDNLQRSSLFLTEDDLEENSPSVLTTDNYNEKPANTGTFLSSQSIEKDIQINADELLSKDNKTPVDKTYDCRTVNESSGGYCIDWPVDQAPKIRVGELIGIRSTANKNEFGLAITRWIKCLPDNRVLAGIQILSHSSSSGKARLDQIVPKHKDVTYYPVLTYEKRQDSKRYLLVTSELFNEGDDLIVKNSQNQEEHLHLESMVESTGLFSQYQVKSKQQMPGDFI